MKNKKIALCISGYLRSFKECYPSIIENVIQDYDCDIFIHTYDKIKAMPSYHNIDDEYDRTNSYNLDIDFLESISNIKTIVVENWDDIKEIFYNYQNVNNIDYTPAVYASLYKIYKCNELKSQYENENNFKYDLVIRTRGDQMFTKKINYNFSENKILINSYPFGDEDYIHECKFDENLSQICINDRFAAGSSLNIDYLSNLYNNMTKYLLRNDMNSPIEKMIYMYLNENVNIELEKRNLKFYVKRSSNRTKCRLCGEQLQK